MATTIVGQVDEHGFATFSQPLGEATPPPTRPHSQERRSIDSTIDEIDFQPVDRQVLVDGARGGGIKVEQEHHGVSRRDHDDEHIQSERNIPTRRPGPGSRRKSIPIQLEKTSTHGRYALRADDHEVREILRRTLAREAVDKNGQKRRPMFSDLVFTKQFTAFDARNPHSGNSPFHGFFTLFWLSIGFMLLRVASSNWRQHGSIFGRNEIIQVIFTKEVFEMFAVDVTMMLSGFFCVALQKVINKGWLSWDGAGWIIQGAWEVVFLVGTLGFAHTRPWAWSQNVFLVLHCIIMLMKQHSYGFYNGYLSEVYKRRTAVQKKISELYAMDPTTAATASPTTAFASSYFDPQHVDKLIRRRMSLSGNDENKLEQEKVDINVVAEVIASGEPLNLEQFAAFKHVLRLEIESLTAEIHGKCTITQNYYPKNLSFRAWLEYIPLPTVVYELEYPRQETIDWLYVAEKLLATFGCLGVMLVVSEAYIYPVVMRTVEMKTTGMSLSDRLLEFPMIIDDLLFPFMLEYLLSWYVIWECILNVLAELTRFADRGFYSDWWNSVSWDQFARDWNKPVHNFLLRHVYHSSISAFKVNKQTATLITFLLSACVHELVMWCIFKRLRGYLMILQMTQLPLAMLSRTKLMKEQRLLGNIMFWFGIFTGPSLLCSLYLIL